MAEGAQRWGTHESPPLLLYSATGDSDDNCVIKLLDMQSYPVIDMAVVDFTGNIERTRPPSPMIFTL